MELKDIIAECNKLAKSLNTDFDLPVKINKRLTRTLGRVCFQGGVPYVMEFSDSMLKTCTHESIMEVIKHEFAHWFAWYESGEVHGHDAYFREICDRIGCTHDRSRNKIERLANAPAPSKYTVVCGDCGRTWHYARMCDTIRYIDTCKCPSCKTKHLNVIKNW